MSKFSYSSENVENKVICVFISSTFFDMQKEADVLILNLLISNKAQCFFCDIFY